MVTSADTLHLGADELALIFDTEGGVAAADLGLFLRRASTVTRSAGAEIYVIGLREGSLAVVAKVVRKGVRAGVEEFKSSPIRTTASAAALVGAAAMALNHAMTPRAGEVTPLAKTGAGLIEDRSIKQINLITVTGDFVLMDKDRAAEVRKLDVQESPKELPPPQVRRLIADARADGIAGTILLVAGEAHFRPDGFRFLVPMTFGPGIRSEIIQSGERILVWGDLHLRDSQPDVLVVRDARPG